MDSCSESVVNPLFCTQCPLDLAFTTKPPGDKKGGADLSTVDADGNVLFRTKYSLRKNLIHFQDAGRHTLLTMMTKVVTVVDSWQAFAGDSTNDKDRVFSMRRSSNTPSEDVWLVFLTANTKEEVCDFKIIGSYHKKIYTFYKGDSSSIVAQVTKEHSIKLSKKKETFGATISANCDYAFVAALITIFRIVYGIDMTITMSLTMTIMNSYKPFFVA